MSSLICQLKILTVLILFFFRLLFSSDAILKKLLIKMSESNKDVGIRIQTFTKQYKNTEQYKKFFTQPIVV